MCDVSDIHVMRRCLLCRHSQHLEIRVHLSVREMNDIKFPHMARNDRQVSRGRNHDLDKELGVSGGPIEEALVPFALQGRLMAVVCILKEKKSWVRMICQNEDVRQVGILCR